MKKLYTLIVLTVLSLATFAQCFVQFTQTNNLCFGQCIGTITAMPNGGTPPYAYSWSNGQTNQTATGLCAGTYSCVVTDALGNICMSTNGGIVITQPTQLNVVTTGINPTSCTNCNGTVSGSASGGTSPYTYVWNPGGQTTVTATGLCSGTYTLTVTDANGCTRTSIWTLTAPGAPTFTTSVNPATQPLCNNGTATASVSNPGTYTYSWTPTGQTTQTATGLSAGTYTVCVTNTGNGCSSCQAITVNCLTGIEENNFDGNVSFYPNPANENVNVFVNAKAEMKLFNVVGEKVGTYNLTVGKNEINISSLPSGIYFLTVETGNGSVTKRLMIK